jgi:hypothetical protein
MKFEFQNSKVGKIEVRKANNSLAADSIWALRRLITSVR